MEFHITGRIVPYVRMTQRSKFADPRAQAYLASQEAMRWQLRQQMAEHGWEMLPPRTPLEVEISFDIWHSMRKSDLDNLAKSVLDAAQGIVYKNDCWIDYLEVYRVQWEPEYITMLRVAVVERALR